MFLERLLPQKFVDESLDIGGNSVGERIHKLIDHVATGDMTADEARKIASIIHKDAEITNQAILLEKVIQLEEKIKAHKARDINFNKCE